MFFSFLQKCVAVLLSLTATLFVATGIQMADSMEGHEYPLISPTEKNEEDVRVMSFNVRNTDLNGVPAPLRRDLGIREILQIMPDSFGLQEATITWMAALRAKLPAYGCVGVARDNGKTILGMGEYSAVFYLREKYKLLDHGDFWLSDTPDEPSYGPGASYRRICTWALLQNKETSETYAHVNTHLDNGSNEAREAGARQIVDFIESKFADTPVVFTADMNTGEGSTAYKIMTAALNDARYAAADSEGADTYHNCTPEDKPVIILDYVMCSKDVTVDVFRVVTDGIDGRFVSDHFPIYADVRFADGEETPVEPPLEG